LDLGSAGLITGYFGPVLVRGQALPILWGSQSPGLMDGKVEPGGVGAAESVKAGPRMPNNWPPGNPAATTGGAYRLPRQPRPPRKLPSVGPVKPPPWGIRGDPCQVLTPRKNQISLSWGLHEAGVLTEPAFILAPQPPEQKSESCFFISRF